MLAFDVSFNREVLGVAGRFFATAADVPALLARAEDDPANARKRGAQARERAGAYDWDDVAARYADLARRLAAREFPRRPSGRSAGDPGDAAAVDPVPQGDGPADLRSVA